MYQPTILGESHGKELLSIARGTLEAFVRHEHPSSPEAHDEKLDRKYGVICTLYKDHEVHSRTAIGLHFPLQSVVDATISAVIAAASEMRIEPPDLGNIKIELSIITEPSPLGAAKHPEKLLNLISPDTDGLILRYGIYESFMLPQEWKGMSKEQFLDALCKRAGLPNGMWKEGGAEISKFNAQIFSE